MAAKGLVLVILAVDLGVLLPALDSTIVGTAMPTVIGSLGGLRIYSWVFSAYLVTYTTSMPVFGKLSDLYGRKRCYLIGIALFVLGSALCGLAGSMEQLIAFRALQGIGGGGLLAIALTIFGDIFSPTERGRMQGYLAGVWGFAALVGPVTGGFIVDHWGWPWVFYVNLPLGALAAGMIAVGLQEGARPRRPVPIDYGGTMTLTAGIVCLLLALLRLAGNPPQSVPLFLVAGLLLGAFLAIEARTVEPILPLTLFRNRSFTVSGLCGFFSGAAMFGVTTFLPLFVQAILGGSPTQAGLMLMPGSLGWTTGSTIGGRLLNRLGYRTLTVFGMGSMTAGYLFLSRLDAGSSFGAVIWASTLVGLGMGFISIAIITTTQNRVEASHRGIATALVLFFRMIGASVGIGGLGAVLTAVLTRHLTTLPSLGQAGGRPVVGPGLDPQVLLSPLGRGQLPAEAVAALRGVLGEAVRAAFSVGLLIALAGLCASAFMPRATPVEDAGKGPGPSGAGAG